MMTGKLPEEAAFSHQGVFSPLAEVKAGNNETLRGPATVELVRDSYKLVEEIMNVGPIGCCNISEQDAEKILSLMQPEINRRVAEEKAKLLERFDEDELEQIISNSLDMDWLPRDAARAIRQAMLAAFQQENSDGR